MDTNEKLAFFRELISCNDHISSWCYDQNGRLIYTNSSNKDLYDRIFLYTKCLERAIDHAQNYSSPSTFSIELGLMWTVAREKTADGYYLHVLGPVFGAEASLHDLHRAIRPWEAAITVEGKKKLLDDIQSLPVVTYANLCRYTLMLHYCLTGEKLSLSEIEPQRSSYVAEHTTRPSSPPDRHRTWMAEQALMHKIETGDINYKAAMEQSISVSSSGKKYLGTPIEQAKLSQVIFITLCVRAAIKGGLSPETAYTLGDSYIRNTQSCTHISDITALGQTMYEDFIQRVHRLKSMPDISPEIQSCCDFINMHLEQEFHLETLASNFGYTPYYFSRKFKKEMNCSLGEYIKTVKMEHAKLLLETTDQSISEIADQLHFCSRTYFADHFRAIVGCTPTEYRQSLRRI